MSLPGYDAWATGGRYRTNPLHIKCGECDHEFGGQACTEYGATWYEPEECPQCGSEILEEWVSDEVEPDPADWYDDEGRHDD